MLLVDSSVWIRIGQNRLSLHDYVEPSEELATCPMVVHEVLRGTRSPIRFDALRAAMKFLTMLDDPMPLARFEEAALFYKSCRAAGVTPSTPDCLIAACAIAHDVALFHLDTDFRHIARAAPDLKLLTRP